MTDSEWQLWTVGAACATVSAVSLLWLIKRGNTVKVEYYERSRRRLEKERRRRLQLVAQLTVDGQLLSDERQRIVELPLLQLIEQLQQGQLTAVQVLRAYQAKALELAALYNCITEFVVTAEDRAAALDKLAESCRGPLHGVPFSVKDCMDLEGYDSTAGLAKYLDQPAASNAPLLQTLIDLGGVPFCKTNVPQTMISFGCSNPVWGSTRNIYDERRVPGGSSGGEAVLVSAGGSPFGVGTDIGGSCRVPALFSGCCGFKPTAGRISCRGMRTVLPATFGVRTTVGFLTREPADLRLLMQLVTSPRESADMYRLDPLVPRVLWNSEMAAGRHRWRVGYLTELALFPATPGCRRALTETVQALTAAGHETVPFQLDLDVTLLELFSRVLQPENGSYMVRSVEDEDVDKSIDTMITMLRLPRWLRSLIAWGTSNSFRYLPHRLRAWTGSTAEAIEMLVAWQRVVDRVVKRWKDEKIDLLVLPGFMCPAPPCDMVSNLVVGGAYTIIFNVLNFPAGVLNVSHETAEDQAALERYATPQVELRWVKEASRGALGQPLGVQVVTLPWMEEQLVAGMEAVRRALDRQPQ